MAYDEQLADRVRDGLRSTRKVEEKKMMGGLTFMVNDKMCVGIVKHDLMARIDPHAYEDALQRKGCREMNFTGRPMKGFVFVGPDGTRTGKNLSYWLGLAIAFNKKATMSRKRKVRWKD